MFKSYDLKTLTWQLLVLALSIYVIMMVKGELKLSNNIQATKVINDCTVAASNINDPNKFDKSNCQNILDVER